MSRMVRIDLIDPSPWAAESREWLADGFDLEAHLEWLTEDIKARGICTPLHVYQVGERFQLLHGHNRLEAAKRNGMMEVPVDLRATLTDEDARREYFIKSNGHQHWSKTKVVRAEWLRTPKASVREVSERAGVSYGLTHRVLDRLREERPDIFTSENTRQDAAGRKRPRTYKRRATGRRKDKPTNPDNVDTANSSEGDMAEGASTNGKGRIKAPEGMTLAQAVREAMHHDGSAAEIAAAYGWSAETYSRMRYLMLLADRDDLPEAERTTVAQCVDRLNTERVIGRIWPEFEPIVNRIYGDAGSRRTHPDKVEANRLTAFERAYGALIQACRYAPDIDVPHLPAERATEIVAELKQAEQSVRTLRRKIEGATR